MDLRANTAVDVLIGPFVDATDGNTTEDSLTLTQAEIKLSKLGQSLTQKNESTSAAFDDDGYYNCMLDATDTNSEGNLVLIVHQSANALPVRHEFNVMAEAAFDSLYVAKDAGFMDVNIKTVGRTDTQETEADNLESACSNYSATRGLTGTAVPAVAADGAFGLPISDAGGLDMDATDANVSLVLTDTAEIGTAGAGLSNISLPATGLDLVLKSSTFALAMADAIWDELLAGHTTADTSGLLLNEWQDGGRLDLIVDAILVDTGEIGTAGAGLSNISLPATGLDLVLKSSTYALAMADAVWDELLAGHVTADTAGLVLNEWQDGGRLDLIVDAILVDTGEIGTAGAGLSNISLPATGLDLVLKSSTYALAMADAIWDELLAGHVTADTAGLVLNEWQDGGRLDLIIDAIVADTGTDGVKLNATQPTGWAANLAASAATIVKGTATGTPTTTTMAATGLSEATDDHFNGRVIIWTSGVLKDQATDITDYTGATDLFTFTAITEAATAGDTFVIV